MKNAQLLISIIVGLILGLVGSRYLFAGSALSLIPWGIAGLVIGYFCANNKIAILNGFVYGFSLTFFFMIFGYHGHFSLVSRFPFFALLGLIGAICGMVLGLIGANFKKFVRR